MQRFRAKRSYKSYQEEHYVDTRGSLWSTFYVSKFFEKFGNDHHWDNMNENVRKYETNGIIFCLMEILKRIRTEVFHAGKSRNQRGQYVETQNAQQ